MIGWAKLRLVPSSFVNRELVPKSENFDVQCSARPENGDDAGDDGNENSSHGGTVSVPVGLLNAKWHGAWGSLLCRNFNVMEFSAYTLEFDATAKGIPLGVMIDAVSEIGPNDLLLSFDVTVALGGITAAPEDLVRFHNGAFGLFFDGSVAGVPAGLNLDAVHCLSRNGICCCPSTAAARWAA